MQHPAKASSAGLERAAEAAGGINDCEQKTQYSHTLYQGLLGGHAFTLPRGNHRFPYNVQTVSKPGYGIVSTSFR
jgi:hypothetical protein